MIVVLFAAEIPFRVILLFIFFVVTCIAKKNLTTMLQNTLVIPVLF